MRHYHIWGGVRFRNAQDQPIDHLVRVLKPYRTRQAAYQASKASTWWSMTVIRQCKDGDRCTTMELIAE